MGTLGVLEAAPNSAPADSAGLLSMGLSVFSSSDHGQVWLGYEASSSVSLLFLSRAEWGAARASHWERCSSFPRKKGGSRESIPFQSLHSSSRHCTSQCHKPLQSLASPRFNLNTPFIKKNI